MIHVLSNMSSEVSRLCQDASEESVSFKFLNMGELFHVGATSNDPMEQTAEATKTVTIRQEDECVFPTN